MLEIWKQWKIPEITNHKYYIESIKQESENLKIIISSSIANPIQKDNYDKIQFNFLVKAYRVFDEHCRLKLFEQLQEKYGKSFLSNCNYFVVENSKYIKWFCRNLRSTKTIPSLNHYVLMDSETVVDIISTNKLVVEKI